MSRVLLQLFEITALYDMRLRPELVLLQKTMMTVEGVARRIYPDHDIWAAADPVVRRWMPASCLPARIRRFADEGRGRLRNIARLVENRRSRDGRDRRDAPAGAAPVVRPGALASGAAFLGGPSSAEQRSANRRRSVRCARGSSVPLSARPAAVSVVVALWSRGLALGLTSFCSANRPCRRRA
jgi:predicted unusual protein kinase regulating ubiquinone biosynthesis (AarF/ABC1/UbiB family)